MITGFRVFIYENLSSLIRDKSGNEVTIVINKRKMYIYFKEFV